MKIPDDVARAAFGLSHDGSDSETEDPILQRIVAIDPKRDPVSLGVLLDPILELIAPMSSLQRSGYLSRMKEHFGWSERQQRGVESDLKKISTRRPIRRSRETREELLSKLKAQETLQEISPAQDFQSGVLNYSVAVDGMAALVTSNREFFLHDEAESHGLRLKPFQEPRRLFSPALVTDFLSGDPPLDPRKLFSDIESYIRSHIYFRDERIPKVISLWSLGTYLYKAFDYYPYLWINAEKQSGKSLLMQVLCPISFNGLYQINPTEAVLFRSVSDSCSTLFIDEAESLSRREKDARSGLFSLLNSGFQKGGTVQRMEKSAKGQYQTLTWDTYSPKAIAGINGIDDVLADRALPIKLIRARPSDPVKRFKEDSAMRTFQQGIRDMCFLFAMRFAPRLHHLYNHPDEATPCPPHLANRDLNLWEPIFLLADVIDVANGDRALYSTLVELSQDMTKTKQEIDQYENDTTKLLTVLNRMRDDGGVVPLKSDDRTETYSCDEVVNYFHNSVEFGWKPNQTWVSRHLRGLSTSTDHHVVVVKTAKTHGKSERVYVIDIAVLAEYTSRYGVGADECVTVSEV